MRGEGAAARGGGRREAGREGGAGRRRGRAGSAAGASAVPGLLSVTPALALAADGAGSAALHLRGRRVLQGAQPGVLPVQGKASCTLKLLCCLVVAVLGGSEPKRCLICSKG